MILAVEVHPLDPVTVTVYVPGAVILAFALLPSPLFQEYVPLPVAVTLMAVVKQVSTVVPELLIIPAAGDWLTVTAVVLTGITGAVHPVALVMLVRLKLVILEELLKITSTQ